MFRPRIFQLSEFGPRDIPTKGGFGSLALGIPQLNECFLPKIREFGPRNIPTKGGFGPKAIPTK